MLPSLTPFLTTMGPLALLVVMAIVFAETGLLVGFFLPGDSLLFSAGLLIAAGVLHVPLWAMVLGVIVAAVAGDQVGFLVGRHLGPRLFRRPESRLFSPRHLEHAHEFFAHHGPKAVVLARFVPVLRTFTPVVAGAGRMSHRRFTAYNVAGAVLWGGGMVLGGYFLGGITFVASHVELITLGLVAVSLVPAAAVVLRGRGASKASTADAVHQEPAAISSWEGI